MPLSFETKTTTIKALLSGSNIFRMPAFQRPYSWEEETAAQLLDDLHSAFMRTETASGRSKSPKDYFLGPLIVVKNGKTSPLDIVDGQQRLATLSIILAVLRDLSNDQRLKAALQEHLATDRKPRVQLRELDQSCFEAWVVKPGGTSLLPKQRDIESDTRILHAIKRIKSDIGKTKHDYIRGLTDFVLNHSHVVYISADNLDDAYILFRSVNSRGQPLSDLDIARAELIGPHVHILSEAQRLADCWDDLEAELGADDVANYLQTILRMVLRTEETDLKYLLREALLDSSKARIFHESLVGFLTDYRRLTDGELAFGESSEIINRRVSCLRVPPFKDWDWRRPALVWLALRPNPKETLEFFRRLDGLCLGLHILGTPKNKLRQRFELIADRILDGEALTSANSELYFSEEEEQRIVEMLDSPIAPKKLFLRALLLRLNAAIPDLEAPIHFPAKVTIEHILPQKPADGSPWLSTFSHANKRQRLCYLLGNHALLTRALNASAKNLEYAKKRAKMFDVNKQQAFPLTTHLNAYPEWDETALLRRHKELTKLARRLMFGATGRF